MFQVSLPPEIPVAPCRRRSGKTGRGVGGGAVVRPLDPPPAPPLASCPPPEEQTYTSSLFQSEPLYQFYQEAKEGRKRQSFLSASSEPEPGLLEEIEADPVYQATAGRRVVDVQPPQPVPSLLTSPAHRSLWAELTQVQMQHQTRIHQHMNLHLNCT